MIYIQKLIQLKKENGQLVDAQLKLLDKSYIRQIMELQETVINGLDDKDIFALSNEEEINACLKKGKIIGCILNKECQLIGFGVYVNYGYDEVNYGYDIDIKGENLLDICQVESIAVLKEYRGNRLQRIICELLEEVARDNKNKVIMATVSPDNIYSLNTLKSLGYRIVKEKMKYGGLRRYILMKNL